MPGFQFEVIAILLIGTATAPRAADPEPDRWVRLDRELADYRRQLEAVRRGHGGVRTLPPVAFSLFGMGDRRKLVSQRGVLRDARTGREVRRWEVRDELIVPPAYTVALETRDGGRVLLVEDEGAVWLEEGGERTALTKAPVKQPDFAGHRHAAVLRVLHQELLVNVIDGKPVPNFLVYKAPWYRDRATMAMAFMETGNLGPIEGWVLGLREPYDRNNGGYVGWPHPARPSASLGRPSPIHRSGHGAIMRPRRPASSPPRPGNHDRCRPPKARVAGPPCSPASAATSAVG